MVNHAKRILPQARTIMCEVSHTPLKTPGSIKQRPRLIYSVQPGNPLPSDSAQEENALMRVMRLAGGSCIHHAQHVDAPRSEETPHEDCGQSKKRNIEPRGIIPRN